MSQNAWTLEKIAELEQHIRDKVKRKKKLSYGEDVVWGAIRNNKPLSVRFIEEIDFMAGIYYDDDDSLV